MKLYYSSTSPFVRKVNILAMETGQDSKLEWIRTNPWIGEDHLVSENPLSKIPTLEMPGGEVIFGSQLICEYLDSLHSGTKLIPADDTRWKVLRLQALADGILEAGILRFMERKRDEQQRSPDWDQLQKNSVQRGLDYLESHLPELEAPLNLGIITVAVLLGWLDFRFSDEDWRIHRPQLSAWYEKFGQRESMQATMPCE